MNTDAKSQKSTIYIDADDEITAIIEKVRAANSNIVALVPPKRAAALQSVVNLKLLQRAAKVSKKNLVLVTTEPALLPLAGTVGMMVAKTASSKPEVPAMPGIVDKPDIHETEIVESGEEPEIDPEKPIGELAGAPATAKTAAEVETIEVGDTAPKAAKAKDKKAKPDKKLKVPNFNTFRNKMLLAGGGLILLIIIFVFANVILPSAHITIKTDTTSVTTNLNVTASTTATSVDADKLVVPAVAKQLKKTDTEKATATGERDDGTKAAGTMSITNCTDDPVTIPAGTALTSGGLSFVTDSGLSLDGGNFNSGNVCKTSGSHVGTVGVTASGNGDKYNVSARSYTTSGLGDVRGYGSSMTGGTSKIVKIVSQGDVDGARQKVLDRIKPAAESELKSQFDKDNVIAINESLKAGEPAVTASPNVGSEGSDVTVSITVTYDQTGVRQDDLKQIIETDVKRQIDTSKQMMQDAGLDKAAFKVTSSTPTETKFQLQTLATAGPQLDAEGIKQQVAGKKKGETTSLILSRPGIKDVDISYSPFWVYSTPKRTSHIKITFEKANAQ